ncbi:hypothetical protein PhCBS80983_g03963 [Powellomyces hirtus]|uniref:Major facilitator superfamily (MFS) profile domain-containing protein n=1 Tax=Powellomyces hirtus TaxID=109895 RepID=A0A507DZP7_9FUNG|nr:hypothetical protein PhCBS80983_g03963 [Powellomyces hirtus]
MPGANERTALLRGASNGSRNQNSGSNREAPQDSAEFGKWRKWVLTLLVTTYTAYYFCKTNLSLAIPHLEDEEGLKRSDITIVLTSGYIMYLAGKFLSGLCVDNFGGKKTLLAGLIGSIVTSVAFTLKVHPAYFATIRGVNQLFSSVGWGACVKIVRGWYPPSRAAHAIAVASLAETLGDALVRVTLGSALLYGLSWQGMFLVSAAVAGLLFVPACFVPGVPSDKDLDDPVEKDEEAHEDMKARSVFTGDDEGLLAIVKDMRVWLLAAQLLVVILVRESFASFVSSLIASELELSKATSSIASAIFPAMGAISSIAGGVLLDKASQNRRGLIPFASLACLTVALLGMWAATPESAGDKALQILKDGSSGGGADMKQIALFLAMIGMIALFLYAPKVIIDGAFVMDLAGGAEKVGSVTAFVTGVGYIGGILSPSISGMVADARGWPDAILLMVGLSAVVTGASGLYWWLDLKKLKGSNNITEDNDA